MKFDELKNELLKRARKANACRIGYAMGLKSENNSDLLKAITENFNWVFCRKIVDAKFLEDNFTDDELLSAGIYTAGAHDLKDKTFIFACGSATVEAYGSATVEACGSATVEAYGSATVEAYGSATVKAWDSATVKAWDSATVKAWDSATVKAYDSATVKAWDSATVKAYGSVYVNDYTEKIKEPSEESIIRDYYNKKIYIKKGTFEIIEVE